MQIEIVRVRLLMILTGFLISVRLSRTVNRVMSDRVDGIGDLGLLSQLTQPIGGNWWF